MYIYFITSIKLMMYILNLCTYTNEHKVFQFINSKYTRLEKFCGKYDDENTKIQGHFNYAVNRAMKKTLVI